MAQIVGAISMIYALHPTFMKSTPGVNPIKLSFKMVRSSQSSNTKGKESTSCEGRNNAGHSFETAI